MKKSLVLAMAMALGVTASAYAANPFSDVPAGHWAYDSVAKLADAGVVDGYGDGAFGGDKLLTRYEMAQITAKAMAKGCNVDKLAAEFADELDTLGVRVANLEKKADNVKITGQARFSYKDFEGENSDSDGAALRTRLWVTGQINEDWTYTGMFQNTQDFSDENGEENTELKRAYVEGKLGGLDVQAGRWNEFPFTANVLDVFVDGVKVAYGDDVRVTAMAGKGAKDSGNAWFCEGYDGTEDSDRIYMAALEGKVLGANAYAALFKVDGVNANEIWNVGFNTEVAKNLVLSAEYMVGDEEVAANNSDDDGWYADLAWKGADAATPGSWGAHVSYYDQSANAYFSPTTDGYANDVFNNDGYEGFAYGVSYTFAKNIVGVVNYYDFEGQKSGDKAETLFSELYFHF